ncbi:MAG TPA: hypothetical protein DCR78_05155 [Pseudomonas sp.]|jgi:hypothetical protein|uniref:hypothetical protein n=1 Tax=Stutzerimonas xanthomarina TaxID=271420 RepID=UPI000E98BF53|nr:hypothetical protein [Stutzerimonas xanthomarina]MBU0810715.1 hypothetical protein [Gammaproteobacteria bacterium]HAQ85810.1 hypothetical protein [Pseudomonas sp.]MBK3847159.1 hypothetical protein [Stutzerimonas xanthomarina]MBU0853329.1 hypothetical protein [Gammaproteobacteria bacterium]MBU1300066.1 hypothetical protein [Gammaproteobacteria bacterium]|tara:strand:+ start:7196 stop:7456 length:261 start_codon:yes stop_codon:yes gene_type:complete
MKSLNIASSVLLALLATTASASQEPTEHEPADSNSQAQQDLDNEASAHGYQNPTGEDPQPRLTEDTIENAHGNDEDMSNGEEPQER